MVGISVSISGLGQLEHLAEALSNWNSNGLMQAMGEKAHEQHVRRVASEKTSPDGPAWAPWRPTTRPGGSLMVRSGGLLGAMSVDISADFARVYDGAYYLIFHQFGTSKMVQREIMGLSAENLAELRDIFNAWVASHLGI